MTTTSAIRSAQPALPPDRSKRILAIAGSLRRDSLNRRLLQAAALRAPAGLVIELYDLRAIPLFDEDVERETGGGPESVACIRRRIASADGVLIATPEYNQSIPGVLKNAIDWLSRPPDEVLAGKPVAIVGASAGRWGTRLAQAALRHTLYATESRVMPAPSLFLGEAEALFDASGTLTDPSTGAALERLLAAFADWIELAVGVRRLA